MSSLKQLVYYFIKFWIRLGLLFYYKSIHAVGLENIPKDKPVLFLSNHQNALMDILLIAITSNKKLWYLTRADVFKNPLFSKLFQLLQMMPVYRIRDGKKNLNKNKDIFKYCGELLKQNEAILLFPEANHSLKRKVRPLSKGFTRIVTTALEQDFFLDLQLVPIGQNYQNPKRSGDTAVVYFGAAIAVQDYIAFKDSNMQLKEAVYTALKSLTTHIENDTSYSTILAELEKEKTDFTRPNEVNTAISKSDFKTSKAFPYNRYAQVSRALFTVLNTPFVLLWLLVLKKRVPEPEFEATFRFGFALLTYSSSYSLSLIILGFIYNMKTACLIIVGHAACNIFLIKVLGITSVDQRK